MGVFSQNILNSIFFWLRHFLVLNFEFWSLLIIFVWLWIDLTEEKGQNQAKNLFVWGICSKHFSFFFLVLISIFFIFLVKFFDIICLFKFRFSLFYVLKHVRLLYLIVLFLLCLLFLLFWVRVSGHVCKCVLFAYVRILELCVRVRALKPRTLNSIFSFSVSLFCLSNMLLSCLVLWF